MSVLASLALACCLAFAAPAMAQNADGFGIIGVSGGVRSRLADHGVTANEIAISSRMTVAF